MYSYVCCCCVITTVQPSDSYTDSGIILFPFLYHVLLLELGYHGYAGITFKSWHHWGHRSGECSLKAFRELFQRADKPSSENFLTLHIASYPHTNRQKVIILSVTLTCFSLTSMICEENTDHLCKSVIYLPSISDPWNDDVHGLWQFIIRSKQSSKNMSPRQNLFFSWSLIKQTKSKFLNIKIILKKCND